MGPLPAGELDAEGDGEARTLVGDDDGDIPARVGDADGDAATREGDGDTEGLGDGEADEPVQSPNRGLQPGPQKACNERERRWL